MSTLLRPPREADHKMPGGEMSKLALVIVGAVAYVLGTKAGRERYEQMTNFA
ncbi:MAG: hypothetical protein ACRDTJ_16985 [Pseudonocardiaceae bacterium]